MSAQTTITTDETTIELVNSLSARGIAKRIGLRRYAKSLGLLNVTFEKPEYKLSQVGQAWQAFHHLLATGRLMGSHELYLRALSPYETLKFVWACRSDTQAIAQEMIQAIVHEVCPLNTEEAAPVVAAEEPAQEAVPEVPAEPVAEEKSPEEQTIEFSLTQPKHYTTMTYVHNGQVGAIFYAKNKAGFDHIVDCNGKPQLTARAGRLVKVKYA
jgi:hypothetical protein